MRFLGDFNGRTFFFGDLWISSTTLELFTDAAGLKGYDVAIQTNLSGGGRNADSSSRPPSAEELVASLNDFLSSAFSVGS